eukprot:1161311-Pelagomonas_calceolata.AAC.3
MQAFTKEVKDKPRLAFCSLCIKQAKAWGHSIKAQGCLRSKRIQEFRPPITKPTPFPTLSCRVTIFLAIYA